MTPDAISEAIDIDLMRRHREHMEAEARRRIEEQDATDELYATAEQRAREGERCD